MPSSDITPASIKLLRTIAEKDDGHGVVFHTEPRSRWRLDGSRYTVNARTFFPLAGNGLVDVGNGSTDPVKITPEGRAYLQKLDHDKKPEPQQSASSAA
ncbi:hypothetical protein [Streptomyces umbrinus]|uniref:hypothetical protein n=1 Tax=Streptomyces umbrinus TaxID=67370 RepID=UPI0033F7E639